MKTKNLAILAIVAAALVAVAKFTSDGGRAKKPAVSGEPVFPALDAGAVAAMEISGGAGTVRVELGDYGWAVTNAFGYPADIVRLREAILALADLKIGHRQPDMSIDPSSAASVALFAADGAPLAKLLLGGSRESAQQEQTPYGMMGGGAAGRYIAREGSPDVFLVKENLSEFAADPKQWIDSQLLSVQAMATQNPIEQKGTYPLPEAQVDRFMLKCVVGYSSRDDERRIMNRFTRPLSTSVKAVVTAEEVAGLREVFDQVYCDEKVGEYILDIVFATRDPKAARLPDLADWIEMGASPRATLFLNMAACGNALLHGRAYATPQDVKEIAHDVLRHRIMPTYEAEAENITADTIIDRILATIPVP